MRTSRQHSTATPGIELVTSDSLEISSEKVRGRRNGQFSGTRLVYDLQADAWLIAENVVTCASHIVALIARLAFVLQPSTRYSFDETQQGNNRRLGRGKAAARDGRLRALFW